MIQCSTRVVLARRLVSSVLRRKQWLSTEGSPSSRIDKCVFGDEKAVDAYTYSEFSIVRAKKKGRTT